MVSIAHRTLILMLFIIMTTFPVGDVMGQEEDGPISMLWSDDSIEGMIPTGLPGINGTYLAMVGSSLSVSHYEANLSMSVQLGDSMLLVGDVSLGGRDVVVGNSNGTVFIGDISTVSSFIRTNLSEVPIEAVRWTSDSLHIFVVSGSSLHVLARNGSILASLNLSAPARSMDMDQTGSLLLVGGEGLDAINVNRSGANVTMTLLSDSILDLEGVVMNVEHLYGDVFAVIERSFGSSKLHKVDPVANETTESLSMDGHASSVDLLSGRDNLLVSVDDDILLVDVHTFQERFRYDTGLGSIASIHWVRETKHLLVLTQPNRLTLWEGFDSIVNAPPTISVGSPFDLSELVGESSGGVLVNMVLYLSDELTTPSGEYRVDGGTWRSLGEGKVIRTVPFLSLGLGKHDIEFRAFDGSAYSEVVHREIWVVEAPSGTGGPFSGERIRPEVVVLAPIQGERMIVVNGKVQISGTYTRGTDPGQATIYAALGQETPQTITMGKDGSWVLELEPEADGLCLRTLSVWAQSSSFPSPMGRSAVVTRTFTSCVSSSDVSQDPGGYIGSNVRFRYMNYNRGTGTYSAYEDIMKDPEGDISVVLDLENTGDRWIEVNLDVRVFGNGWDLEADTDEIILPPEISYEHTMSLPFLLNIPTGYYTMMTSVTGGDGTLIQEVETSLEVRNFMGIPDALSISSGIFLANVVLLLVIMNRKRDKEPESGGDGKGA